jgi:ABC-type transport system involved in multi-copper enzyme maturation permease subunit
MSGSLLNANDLRSFGALVRNCTSGELRKFRRVSFLLSIFVTQGLLTLLIVGFAWSRSEKSSDPMNLTTGFDLALFFLGILTICICASHTAQEYSHGTLRGVLTRSTHRGAFMLGKYLSLASLIFLLTLYTFTLSTLISLYMSKRHHINLLESLHGSALMTTLAHGANGYAGTMALGVFGIALGFLARSSIMATSIALLWALIIESALSGALPAIGKWLPATNFESLAQSGTSGASYQHSLMMSALYLLLAVVPTSYLFATRDISQ